jgi:hypothetical protein
MTLLNGFVILALLSLAVTLLGGALMNRWSRGLLPVPLLYVIGLLYAVTLDGSGGFFMGSERDWMLGLLLYTLPSALVGLAVGVTTLRSGRADDNVKLTVSMRKAAAGVGLVAGIGGMLCLWAVS